MNDEQQQTEKQREEALRQMLAPFHDLRFAVLATSDKGGPYTSLISFVLTNDRRTLIFATPRATRKFRNLEADPRVSILIDNRSQTPEDLNRAEAVTLLGAAKLVEAGPLKEEYSGIFAARHPDLKEFVNDRGTALIAVTIEEAVHVGQFRNVTAWTRVG